MPHVLYALRHVRYALLHASDNQGSTALSDPAGAEPLPSVS